MPGYTPQTAQTVISVCNDYESGLSFHKISKKHGISTRQVNNILNAHSIKIRTNSEAQKLSLQQGRPHPTKGKKRSAKVKKKISEKVFKNWCNKPPEYKDKVRSRAKKQWQDKTDQEKYEFQQAAHKAILKTAKDGSKLERELYRDLTFCGYKVEYHKEQLIANQRMQLDLFLPKQMIAVEVDGPSHFDPIWGYDSLQKNQSADNEKNGLLLTSGFVIIRVKNTRKNYSQISRRQATQKIIDAIKECEREWPPLEKRIIHLEI
jgi:very-short-patch-repair endonuclease